MPVTLGIVGCGVVALLLCLGGVYVQAEHIVYQEPYPIVALLLALAVPYLAACWLVWRAPASRKTLVLVLAFAAAFRAVAVFAPPELSTDMYRYIWDGRVQAAGINPYLYPPADPALAHLRDEEIFPEINRPEDVRTIYPPGAQAMFFLVTRVSESVSWLKLAWVLFEAVGVAALIGLLRSHGLPLQRALLYAWHPLPISEFAGNGHVDVLMVTFVLLALYFYRCGRHGWVGAALAAATLSKFFPLIFAPALWRRWGWRMPTVLAGVVVLGYLPYVLTAGAPQVRSRPAVAGQALPRAEPAAPAAPAGGGAEAAAAPSSWLWKVQMALGSFSNVNDEDQVLSGNRFYLVHLARTILPDLVAKGLFVLVAAASRAGSR